MVGDNRERDFYGKAGRICPGAELVRLSRPGLDSDEQEVEVKAAQEETVLRF